MKHLVLIVCLLPNFLNAQALRDVNFRYLYDSEVPVAMSFRPVREASQWRCFYDLAIRDSSETVSIEWQIRKSLNDREASAVPEHIISTQNSSQVTGIVTTNFVDDLQLLVAVVKLSKVEKPYLFYTTLEPKYPERFKLTANGEILIKPFVKTGSSVATEPPQTVTVSYYNDDFPTAPLAFSEALGKVSRSMIVDSTFSMSSSATLQSPGLYLIQQDTTSAEGVAIRVEDDYPRLAKIKSIAEPLIYICTNQEYTRMKNAGGDKKAFDKVILSITKDSERARQLMRSYFRRVELANTYFTSYKEGWKTDRGMIFIIFGIPDEVTRFGDREVWSYKRSEYRVNFEFVKSPSIFDPNNYVLLRHKRYTETWYQVVDLWRNARF